MKVPAAIERDPVCQVCGELMAYFETEYDPKSGASCYNWLCQYCKATVSVVEPNPPKTTIIMKEKENEAKEDR